jgi:hypothetical protein
LRQRDREDEDEQGRFGGADGDVGVGAQSRPAR